MIAYISGKITGIEEQAPKLFAQGARDIIAMGHKPVNPMLLPHNHDKSWQSFMREDIKALCDCEAIYMLSNWMDSKGAGVELQVAVALKLQVIFQPDTPTR